MMLTKEQLEIRRAGIGGSDAAPICGKSIYKGNTPLKVYLDKIGEADPYEPSIDMRMGSSLEDLVLDLYSEHTGLSVGSRGLFGKRGSYQLANIDGIDSEGNGVDAKVLRSTDGFGEPGTDQMPNDLLFQGAHYCHVFDIDTWHFPVLFKMYTKFEIYTYRRNKKFEEKLIARENEFMEEFVLKRRPPIATCHEDILKVYTHSDNSKVIEGSMEVIKKITDIFEADKIIKEKTIIKDSLKAEVQDYMKDACAITSLGKEMISWRSNDSLTLDEKKLKTLFPEAYKACLVKKTGRRFLLKGK